MTNRLPIATQFCAAEVNVGNGWTLFLDGNSKITRANGSYAEPKPNAFSLPAASVDPTSDACPGSTKVCRESCYVRGLAKHAPDLYAHYTQNADTLREILSAPFPERQLAAFLLAKWIEENAPAGFRWHVSGDVWGPDHAHWIVTVCNDAPDVPFWIYTRTLEAVPILRRAPNLAVNVSADRENYWSAAYTAGETGARLTFLADTAGPLPYLPPGSVIFPDYALRGRDLADPTSSPWWVSLTREQRAMICPSDFFGQSESARCGPCRKCLT